MAHSQVNIGFRERSFGKTFSEHLILTLARLDNWRRETAQRRAVNDLTDDSLRDIGYPTTAAPKPVIEVEAGLMSKLMSMR